MHILVLPKWYPGRNDPQLGDFVRKQTLAVALHHRVSVVFVVPLDSAEQPVVEEVSEADGAWELRCYYRPSRSVWGPWRKLVNLFRYRSAYRQGLRRLERERGRPDLVHVHILVRPALVALGLRWRWGVPFLISEQSSEYMDGSWDAKSPVFRWFSRWLAHRASAFTAVSRHLGEAIRQRGLHAAPDVVPNVIPGLGLPLPPAGVPGRFLMVADLVDRIKNVSGVLQALKQVRRDHAAARLDVIGDGPDGARLQALAAELGLADAVRWHGRVANSTVLARMAEAQAVIVNSRVETFSVVTGEALALGRPVIATRCGGPEQMVTDGNGLLIPVDDAAALAAAMCTVMDHPERYPPDRIRASIAGKGDPEAIGRAFGCIYERIKSHG